MDLSNGSGGIDSSKLVDYFTKQLPLDLAQMAILRDEIARRQGAMTAVDEANQAKIDADAYLAKAKAEAAELVSSANTQKQLADAKLKELNQQQKDLDAKQISFDADIDFKNVTLDKRKKIADALDASLTKREIEVKAKEAVNTATETRLASYETELNSRIKAFQDKVTSINI